MDTAGPCEDALGRGLDSVSQRKGGLLPAAFPDPQWGCVVRALRGGGESTAPGKCPGRWGLARWGEGPEQPSKASSSGRKEKVRSTNNAGFSQARCLESESPV